MAILAIPSLIALVAHSSGGAILSTSAGGYVAGTLIPASVVTAAPVIGVVAVTAVAVAAGAYLCLHGVPSVLADVLIQKGAATATTATTATEAAIDAVAPAAASKAAAILVPSGTTSILVPVACVAAVLIALAAVGYYAYTHSETVKETVDDLANKARSATAEQMDALKATELIDDFKAALARFVESAKQLASDAATRVKDTAKDVSDSVSQFAGSAAEEIAAEYEQAKAYLKKVAKQFD
jgi:hypothetical protein